MQRMLIPWLLVWLVVLAAPATAGEAQAQFPATVVRIVDGDTMVVAFHAAGASLGTADDRVRLVGIDTMESARNDKLQRDARRYGIAEETLLHWGLEAKRWMAAVNGRRAVITLPGRDRQDRYGRPLVRIFVAGEDLNKRLVLEGLAVVTRAFEFDDKQAYLAAEDWAFAQRRGFWSDPAFRRALRGAVEPLHNWSPAARLYPLLSP